MNVPLKRIPILAIAEVMNQIQNTEPKHMVWYRGHIISPTLPSSFMDIRV